jgi:hypothetical protein
MSEQTIDRRETLEKWIAALRSGKYKQTSGELERRGKYCCLGVLCDVVDPSGWHCGNYRYDGEELQCSLPTKLRLGVGIQTRQETQLIELNDDKGESFVEIADWIEKHILPRAKRPATSSAQEQNAP